MIKVKDSDGNVFTSDMNIESDYSILEIHFCTSYTTIEVQYPVIDENGNKAFKTKSIYTEPDNNRMGAIDYLAFNGSEEFGEFIND